MTKATWRVIKESTQKVIKCPKCKGKIDVTVPIQAFFRRTGRLGGHVNHGTPIPDEDRNKMDIITEIRCPICDREITTRQILKIYFKPLGKIGGTISHRTLTSRKASQMGKISGRVRREKKQLEQERLEKKRLRQESLERERLEKEKQEKLDKDESLMLKGLKVIEASETAIAGKDKNGS